jgi:transcriptional regulator with XRE-family HTH domain
MRQKATAGYDERLRQALERGPRTMALRPLADAIRERHPDLRGSSYGGIRSYVEGRVLNPRVELLRAIAGVLGVRPEWLAFDDGEMTLEDEVARATAPESWIKGGGSIRDLVERFGDWPDAALHATYTLLVERYTPAELAEYIEGPDGRKVMRAFAVRAQLVKAVLDPLVTLGFLPVERSRTEAADDYIAAVSLAIRQYARAHPKGGHSDEA